jgi:disulfide bond formation protein DsbB
MRKMLLAQPVVRCDEVAWSLFGISMAGYNALISLGLAVFGLAALRHDLRRRGLSPSRA